MENEVRQLVTLPFQQLLEASRLALDNASGSAQMETGARSLIKGIEMGLERILPTCKQYLDLYGVNFVNALKGNAQLRELQEKLEMERWEFEDKLVDERLGAQDFANAKKVVADITIKIVTTLRWMKVEVPSPSRSPALQPPSYEDDSPEATAPSSEGQRTVRPAAGSPATTEVPPAPTDNVDEAPPVMSTQSGPDPGYDNHYPVNHDNSRRQALPGAPQLPSKIPVTVAVPAPTTSSSLVASVVETTTPPATPKGTVSPSAQPIPPPPPPPPQGNPWSVSDSPPLVRPPGSVVGNDEIGGNIVRRPDEPPSPDSLHPRGPLLPESSGSRPEVKQQTATTAPTSPSDSDPDQSGRRKSSLSVLHGQLSGGPWSSTPTLEMSANFASATRSQSYQNHLRASISSSTLSPTEKSSISDIDGLPPQQGYPPDHRGSTASLTSGAVGGPSPAGADDSASGFSGPRDSTVIVSPMTESDSSAPWSETRGSVSTPLDWSCMLPRPISLHPLPTPTTRGLGIVRRDENTSGGPAGAKHDNDEAAMNAPQPLHPHAPPSQPRSGSSDLRRENEAPEPVIPPPCGDINPFSSGLILVDGTMGAAGPGPASSGGAGGAADLHGQALVPSAPIGPMSSFCQYRGFCSGALEVMRGGTGVKKIKKPGYATQIVAKCNGCLFELEWAQVDLDRRGEDSANFVSRGVGFRVRFLSKSHLATKRVDEKLYGCVFCNNLGRTVEESDATVFFSEKKLFAHLARHPRPLPRVPGLTVIEGAEIPRELKNNYDLQFFNPPLKSIMAPIMSEVSRLPSATAIETVKPGHRLMRRPPEPPRSARGAGEGSRNPAPSPLSFAVGQRIVGIKFPDEYEGAWATGWTDGEWGAIPADSIKLEPPPLDQVEMKGTSFMHAEARWKWQHKDKEKGGWLKFEKGEIITNINWISQDHWCWYGCNKAGKWGCFPKSHINESSLRESLPRNPARDSASLSDLSVNSGTIRWRDNILGQVVSLGRRATGGGGDAESIRFPPGTPS